MYGWREIALVMDAEIGGDWTFLDLPTFQEVTSTRHGNMMDFETYKPVERYGVE
jgi:hypothetical protein